MCPTTCPDTYESLASRLAARSVPQPDTGCIVWTGARIPAGYGSLSFRRKSQLTHRLAYELAHGPIPDGLCVLHRCDNRPCLNPDHLFLGTKGDNARDMTAKGRHPRQHGEAHSQARLTEAAVLAIRADTRVMRLIAADLGVSERTVWDAKNRRTWTHL